MTTCGFVNVFVPGCVGFGKDVRRGRSDVSRVVIYMGARQSKTKKPGYVDPEMEAIVLVPPPPLPRPQVPDRDNPPDVFIPKFIDPTRGLPPGVEPADWIAALYARDYVPKPSEVRRTILKAFIGRDETHLYLVRNGVGVIAEANTMEKEIGPYRGTRSLQAIQLITELLLERMRNCEMEGDDSKTIWLGRAVFQGDRIKRGARQKLKSIWDVIYDAKIKLGVDVDAWIRNHRVRFDRSFYERVFEEYFMQGCHSTITNFALLKPEPKLKKKIKKLNRKKAVALQMRRSLGDPVVFDDEDEEDWGGPGSADDDDDDDAYDYDRIGDASDTRVGERLGAIFGEDDDDDADEDDARGRNKDDDDFLDDDEFDAKLLELYSSRPSTKKEVDTAYRNSRRQSHISSRQANHSVTEIYARETGVDHDDDDDDTFNARDNGGYDADGNYVGTTSTAEARSSGGSLMDAFL
mmetsp:Transcript_4942/g.9959  ORF Transcript_4942/g.9959 Transcript_4942/m.9959 type:complete len:464 (-) Transcript_4942:2384-3775(-)|eukprot:CAMPEP_0184687652 /NCGR_PEP_ID=MMETSP0312-20130426/27212_1 /TAXON_ID=31354 /ORGANISM="Compsopogon coeruleus, Strain SAG 36.94" /LENGTH=463 /DNA_ID=CAMNT_0027144025 /DNA_START=20 /DNA_END=1411 /DNA_ORIENTATION=+